MKLKIWNVFVYLMILVSVGLVSAASGNAVQLAVDLGTASDFVILSKTGISTTGVTAITGDIGVSPIDSTAITGFGLIMDSSGTFSKSSLVTGNVYAANYGVPTPTVMGTAIGDMQTAYTDAAGRVTPDFSDLGAGEIGGLTLSPGLYKWGTGVTVSNDVTINGSATDVWIFQIAGTLGISSGKQVILTGGAQADNIFWQVAGQTTLGTTSVFEGNILCQTAIVLNTGSTLNGRALAQTAVTADANSIVLSVLASPVLTTINLLPVSATINVGATQQLNSTSLDQYSAPISAVISYASDNLSVATVDSNGLVTAVAVGSAVITASSGAVSDTSAISVQAAPVLTTINLLPVSATINVGATQQLNATSLDQYSQPIVATILYASDNVSVATVDSNGLVTAVAAGSAVINASSGAVSDTSAITVQTAAPILNSIGARSVTQGVLLTIPITATSPDSLSLTFGISGKPATASFTDNLDGTAVFSWTPAAGDAGTVANVNFTVTDSFRSASEIVAITVNLFDAPVTLQTEPVNTSKNADYNVLLNATGFNSTPIAYINYSLNGGATVQIIGGSGNVLISTEGNNTLTFYAVDTSGNIEAPTTINALLDKTAPSITSFTLSATTVNVGDAITGACTVTDNLYVGIAGVLSGIDTASAGSKNATCTATDLAGNFVTSSVAYTVNSVSSGSSGSSGGGGGSRAQCNDYMDNDNDGLKDYPDDPGCTSRYDNSEINSAVSQQGSCQERWICTAWQPADCNSEQMQTRDCEEVNECGTYNYKEQTMRACPKTASTVDLSTAEQDVVTISQGNNANTQVGKNQITGGVVMDTFSGRVWANMTSQWNQFFDWVSYIFFGA